MEARSHRGGTRDTEGTKKKKDRGRGEGGRVTFACWMEGTGLPKAQELGMPAFLAALV